MTSFVCEHAGCSRLATWQRSVTLLANHVPEYLCERHYQELVTQHPRFGQHYDALGDPAQETDVDLQAPTLLLSAQP